MVDDGSLLVLENDTLTYYQRATGIDVQAWVDRNTIPDVDLIRENARSDIPAGWDRVWNPQRGDTIGRVAERTGTPVQATKPPTQTCRPT